MTSSYFCEYPGARKTSALCVSVRTHAAYVNQCARNSWRREGGEGGRAEREEGSACLSVCVFALLSKEQLYRLYEQATREPYSFLFVYNLKPRNEMFYKRFEERFALEKDADGSGAQLPGPEAVRQLHADQREV